MFINSLGLNNFKCFKRVGLDISKITILTGANSSGKSSLLYSLLGVLQTDRFPFFFSPNGDFINMGDFREISYKHDNRNEIKINLRLSQEDKDYSSIDVTFVNNRYDKMPKLYSLNYESNSFVLRFEKTRKYNAYYKFKPDTDLFFKLFFSDKFTTAMENILEVVQSKLNDTKKKKESLHFKEEMQKDLSEHQNEGRLEFTNLKDFFTQISKINNKATQIFLQNNIDKIASHFRDMNKRFNYISSFRLHPERTYYQKSESILKVGKYGENYIDQILDWELKKSKRFTELNKVLRKLNLLNEIKTKRLSGGRFEILGRIIPEGIISSISDIGFGVSQLLPIIVADLQLGKNSILMISQPEIHLHPSVQADLANYFVDQMSNENKRFLIETHSEYLLNRFRLLITKGILSEDDIKVYYLRNEKDQSNLFKIGFHKNGEIEGAPKDFFETYMMDVMDIAMEAK